MDADDRHKFMHWMNRCEAIAGSGTYLLNGHPEAQLTILKQTLRQAAAEGVEWQKIYEFIYKTWHPRRPHFPDPSAITIHTVPRR